MISAQFIVGLCYHLGYGTRQSDSDAIKWYKKASAQGLVKGEFGLLFIEDPNYKFTIIPVEKNPGNFF